jgi:CRISPR system Cascade subunit CasB
MEDEQKQHRPAAFIQQILVFIKNKDLGKLAELRGVVRGTNADYLRATKHVAPYLGDTSNKHKDDCFYVVGGLFAYHPDHNQEEHYTLGKAFGKLRGESGSMDQRFMALLATSSDALAKPLFQTISLLKTKGISVNYLRLLDDLCHWHHDENRIQKRWARDYFRSSNNTNDTSDDSDNTENESENSDEN